MNGQRRTPPKGENNNNNGLDLGQKKEPPAGSPNSGTSSASSTPAPPPPKKSHTQEDIKPPTPKSTPPSSSVAAADLAAGLKAAVAGGGGAGLMPPHYGPLGGFPPPPPAGNGLAAAASAADAAAAAAAAAGYRSPYDPHPALRAPPMGLAAPGGKPYVRFSVSPVLARAAANASSFGMKPFWKNREKTVVWATFFSNIWKSCNVIYSYNWAVVASLKGLCQQQHAFLNTPEAAFWPVLAKHSFVLKEYLICRFVFQAWPMLTFSILQGLFFPR
jgi:hypothetical protein